MEPTIIFAVALAGALAILAGIFEDLESDAGSQSNPNSQVQLAPQIGHLHRYFNKAISGEPPAYGFWSATGATVAVLLQTRFLSGFGEMHSVILASIFGALVAASILSFYAIFAHMSRTASMRPFKQPLQLDVILSTRPWGTANRTGCRCASFRLMYSVKAKFGLPTGIGAHNIPSSWAWLKSQESTVRKVCDMSSNAAGIILGADSLFIGPIENAPYAFPTAAMIDMLCADSALDFGIKHIEEHPYSLA